MAGDWIPMRLDLAEDPAVLAVADVTGLDTYAVVGRLHRLWSWANAQLENGHAPSVTLFRIDALVGVTGFAQGMVDAGWLVVSDHGITFPKFGVWNSQGAKKRLLASRRKARERVAKMSRSQRDKSVTKEEKRRDIREDPPNPPGGGTVPRRSPKVRTPRPPKKPRERNPLFDSLSEVSGMDPVTAGGTIGTAAALLASADPPYTPDEVREFGKRFWELCPYAADNNRPRPTPPEIAKNIGLIRAGPGSLQPTNGRHVKLDPVTETAMRTALDLFRENP